MFFFEGRVDVLDFCRPMMDNKSESKKYYQAQDDPLFVEVAMKFKKFPVVDNEK